MSKEKKVACSLYRRFVLCLTFLLLPLAPGLLSAADDAGNAPRLVTFREYLEAVEKHSLDLQGQRENLTSAKAGVSIAGVRPDPLLTAGIG